ncbi:DUF1523 family protein [Phaeobacter inhibens]|uniref:DUF1523 family protein n=1 Tax=Phaeobacter inhibens TaxID=221822 RepID=UPI0021A56AF3|nr:DUF1523 family protein [Phaeobacter inhibens]UWR58505.1 DUF1523 family protein [Phaeobacter inhibens]UWR63978.1 DUF1523 family protein [Phaeobacter inhibens]UWS03464.1 DUF1523 family protein [Phaeobacter inhibens]
MRYVKWVFILTIWLLAGAFLHYTLPQNDVVRVVKTEVRRVDFGENSIFWAQQDTAQESATSVNRDVRFVEAFLPNGRPIVYRNEDTGWGWPPYFKLDSSNLQAELTDLASTKADPQWVLLRHYGWRNEFMSIFPNAVAVKPVDGPEYSQVNWFNIIFLTMLAAVVWALYVRWRRFRQARIDPMVENVEDSLYAASDALSERRSRFRRWLDSWKQK